MNEQFWSKVPFDLLPLIKKFGKIDKGLLLLLRIINLFP